MPVNKQVIRLKQSSPAVVYAGLAILFILFVHSGIPVVEGLWRDASDTVLFWAALQVTLYTYLALSIATTLWCRNWFRQNWYVNAIIFVIAGFLLLMINFNR